MLTNHLMKFALIATILTFLFRHFLSYGIEAKSVFIIIISASFYGAAMFASGLFFGKKDNDYLPFYDIGFRFHLTTYLIHIIVSELYYLLCLNSKFENNIQSIHTTAIIWGLFLFIHFLFFVWTRKKSINHIDRENLFD